MSSKSPKPPRGRKSLWHQFIVKRRNRRLLVALSVVAIVVVIAIISSQVYMTSVSNVKVSNKLQTSSQSSSAKSKHSQSSSKVPQVTASQPGPDEKVAYLTFDDGPSKFTPQLLNILEQNNVKATFFIAFMGEDTPEKRSYIQKEAADGNALGVHSWTHNYSYIYSSEQNFLTDFNTMKSIITSATGVQPNICRFPGGIGNTVSLKHHGNTPIMPTLLSDVNNMGFTAFDWNAGGEDAEIPRPASGQQFASEIMKEVGNTKHPIILMHDLYQVSINTVPILIQELRAEGYNFSPLTPAIKPVQQRPVLSRK